jgi:hypothetical protein
MGRTQFISCGGEIDEGFWAYDVAVGLLLKHLIDQAREHLHRSPWLSECIEQWRVTALVSDYALCFGPAWTDEQRDLVHALIGKACRELEKSPAITAEVASSWKILDGAGIALRNALEFPTAPVVELGRAIQALMEGTLPRPPQGTWWLYGCEDGRTTLQRQS